MGKAIIKRQKPPEKAPAYMQARKTKMPFFVPEWFHKANAVFFVATVFGFAILLVYLVVTH